MAAYSKVSALCFSPCDHLLFAGGVGSVSRLEVGGNLLHNILYKPVKLKLNDFQQKPVKCMVPLMGNSQLMIASTEHLSHSLDMWSPTVWQGETERGEGDTVKEDDYVKVESTNVEDRAEDEDCVRDKESKVEEEEHHEEEVYVPPKDEDEHQTATNSHELKNGMVFETKEAAMNFVKAFSRDQNTAFVIKDNRNKPGCPLLYCCKHGKKRLTESKGKRPIQSTVKKNCPAFIRFYVRATGETVLTQGSL